MSPRASVGNILLCVIQVNVPKHQVISNSSLRLGKFCNASDGDFSSLIHSDAVSFFTISAVAPSEVFQCRVRRTVYQSKEKQDHRPPQSKEILLLDQQEQLLSYSFVHIGPWVVLLQSCSLLHVSYTNNFALILSLHLMCIEQDSTTWSLDYLFFSLLNSQILVQSRNNQQEHLTLDVWELARSAEVDSSVAVDASNMMLDGRLVWKTLSLP